MVPVQKALSQKAGCTAACLAIALLDCVGLRSMKLESLDVNTVTGGSTVPSGTPALLRAIMPAGKSW